MQPQAASKSPTVNVALSQYLVIIPTLFSDCLLLFSRPGADPADGDVLLDGKQARRSSGHSVT